MRQFTEWSSLEEGYQPTQAVLEVMEELDKIDRELIAAGKMVDYFLEEVATHSPSCECSKCLKSNEIFEQDMREQEEAVLSKKKCGCKMTEACDTCSGYDDAKQSGLI